MTILKEVNFDGLVGPTHNYAGLSPGNLASTSNAALTSNPREAALQGLRKMKLMRDLGLTQGFFPPHERPHLGALRALGLVGTDAEIVAQAFKQLPRVLAACYSASAMWTANAATIASSEDTADGRVHFTPANLLSNFHRSLEAPQTTTILRRVFHDSKCFQVHDALPASDWFGDEGAANHTRLGSPGRAGGLNCFVYGRTVFDSSAPAPRRFPARQTREACEAIARCHGLSPEHVVFAQQNPDAIDAGVFHNDVIAVGHGEFLFLHERAYVGQAAVVKELRTRFTKRCGTELTVLEVKDREVSLADAVKSYLFNGQLLNTPKGDTVLIAPREAENTPAVKRYLDELLASGKSPLRRVIYMDVRQSMNNGGGPACLRLRVPLTDKELARCHPPMILDDAMHAKLGAWIEKHYRDRLTPADLADPKLVLEVREALDALTQLLQLGSLYPFQA